MTYLFKLARRGARLRAIALPLVAAAFAGCDADQLTNTSDTTTPIETAEPIATTPLFATGFRGGIPFGTYALPTGEFGEVYNGAMRNIWPEFLLGELAEIKARGGKVILMFAGSEIHYKDAEGHFSLSKWKARVDRFRGVNFSAYVSDGTIVGHYLIDEPQDAYNWNGQPIPPSMVEEMARYSKQYWPTMVTIARTEPGYLDNWSGTYTYLDAAWAQYTGRRGDPYAYIRENVANAERLGLGLVVGLNVIHGGDPNLTPMSAPEVERFGTALLSSSYPCAFISWQYNNSYFEQSGVRSAMASLSQKAANRGSKSCRGTDGQTSAPTAPTLPSTNGIQLKARGWVSTGRLVMELTWAGASGSTVDLYRNGVKLRNTANDGKALSTKLSTQLGTYTFKVCETGSTRCSNNASVTF
jgi:hypothetical protein